jgi:sigma54-dependent transcription regulator
MDRTSTSSREAARGRVDLLPARLIAVLQSDRPLAASRLIRLDDVDELIVRRADPAHLRRTDEGDLRRLSAGLPDRHLSAPHARLVRTLGRWVLEDAGSKNGCRINGASRDRAALVDRDVIELGHTVFRFRAGGEPAHGLVLGEAPLAPLPTGPRTFNPALALLLRDLARVAAAPVAVILRGETGTGKEVAARAVHDASGRAGPFVAVNCGALPAGLIESELFGHRRGAFSGAGEDRLGHVRAAHGGTLLLDEIGDLPLPAQAALLRVLQEGAVTPVGDSRPVRVDVRVLAASHRDLPALVAAGHFRADLYARLAGLVVTLPPLRDRSEDLGLILADRIPAHTAEPDRVRLGPGAAHALLLHGWPLNVRELDQALAAAIPLAAGEPIGLDHLPAALRPAAASGAGADRQLSGSDLRRRAEMDEQLRAARGNVAAVARALRTTRAQIHRWARRLGIDLDAYR